MDSKNSIEDEQDNSCGACTFFGKLTLCPRRERYAGATPCRIFKRKIEATSPIFPLLPDTGVGKSKEEVSESPSLMWYLVPFFFSILGGIIAYVGVKNDDEDMAGNLLVFGVIMFVIELLILWFIS